MPTTAQSRSIIWKLTLCYWQVSQTAAHGLGNKKRDSLFFQPLCHVLWKQILEWQQKLVPLFKATMPVIMTQESVSQLIWIINFGAVLERKTWKCSPFGISLCTSNSLWSSGLTSSLRIWQASTMWQTENKGMRERRWASVWFSKVFPVNTNCQSFSQYRQNIFGASWIR